MLDDILLQVEKPGRYIGQEWNMSRKDFHNCNIKFALCFPDLYELGMSNLGFRIIYGILNQIPDVCCERFFSYATDMEQILRQKNYSAFSLENKKDLKDFDIIGFSLSYELNYTNVLAMLELGSIPLESALRDNTHPLVIAGGPCALNPEPMYEFFDLFVIGEAEEVIIEIIDAYRRYKDEFKSAKMSRQELLIILSQIEGVYCPSLYEVKYSPEGKIESFRSKFPEAPGRVFKRFVRDLNSAYFPEDRLVPYIQIIHDRITLEIMRGCPNRCRFCQARTQYFPFRQRNKENLLSLAKDIYQKTGYEDISLGGLSVSDYPGIEELLSCLIGCFKDKAVSVSLPSLKPKAIVGDLSALIATIRKTGLTFAPEAATERMRNILAKDFNLADFFQVIEQAFLKGYQHIKLYFMIGLPSEREEDLDAIVNLAQEVSQLRKKMNLSFSSLKGDTKTKKVAANKGPAQVNISINTLVPKPHTPFQWLGMQDIDTVMSKQDYLKTSLRNYKRLKLSLHDPYMTFLEGVFSRGDRRLSKVISCAFKKGARFDAWKNHFILERWLQAFKESDVDPHFYLQERSADEWLPWDFLNIGVEKSGLLAEYKQTLSFC